MASQASNNFRYLLATKAIDMANDVFKIMLMGSGFTFDPDTHDELADVSADELAAGYGYTTGGNTLSGVSVDIDTVNDRVNVTWNNTSWTASGGDVGPVCGAIIYDDTVTDDPIVGFIDFEGEYTEADGGMATIANITVVI